MGTTTISTHLVADKLVSASKRAKAANVNYAATDEVVKYTNRVNIHALDGDGSVVRRRRWHMAARMTWVIFGLDHGSQWVPCYMCGRIFHAWTMDAEHIDPIRGSIVGNLILACHEDNRKKSDTAIPAASVRDKLLAIAHGWEYPQGPRNADPLYCAFKRRPDGSGMDSWEYGTPEPSGLRFVGSA